MNIIRFEEFAPKKSGGGVSHDISVQEEALVNSYVVKQGPIYRCVIEGCSYCVISKADMAIHVRRHLRIKPYRCEYCTYAASHKSDVRVHIKKVHSSREPGARLRKALEHGSYNMWDKDTP